jgi:hypothetical protein
MDYHAIVCENKLPFDTFSDANLVARRKGISVYKCGVCDKYHLTSNPGKKGKGKLKPKVARRKKNKYYTYLK